jgi:hypothetical protein
LFIICANITVLRTYVYYCYFQSFKELIFTLFLSPLFQAGCKSKNLFFINQKYILLRLFSLKQAPFFKECKDTDSTINRQTLSLLFNKFYTVILCKRSRYLYEENVKEHHPFLRAGCKYRMETFIGKLNFIIKLNKKIGSVESTMDKGIQEKSFF